MKRLLCLAGLTLALHGVAFAQVTDCPPAAVEPTPARMQAGIKTARDHGFLWRVRKDGRDSWLYGTLHVARFEWMFPGPTVLTALKASDTIALELDLLDHDIQRRMASGIAASTGAPLPEPLKQRVLRQAEAECLPAQVLAPLSPELQVATLESLVGRRDGLYPDYGLDVMLANWGHTAARTVVSLETPELQLATLTMPTHAESIEFVETALAEMEAGRARPALQRIAQVWADGDLDTLSRYESWCECVKTSADRAALARLLDARNPALADGIAALHADGRRVFAAIGSLHMIGSLGLPALLAQRGFEVQRIQRPR